MKPNAAESTIHTPESAAQKDGLEPPSAIGSGLPGFRELSGAMQKYERQLTWIRRNLIEDIRMVSMRCRAVRSWLLRIKCAGICSDLATNSEAALLLDR
jgi:hypothetical protein